MSARPAKRSPKFTQSPRQEMPTQALPILATADLGKKVPSCVPMMKSKGNAEGLTHLTIENGPEERSA